MHKRSSNVQKPRRHGCLLGVTLYSELSNFHRTYVARGGQTSDMQCIVQLNDTLIKADIKSRILENLSIVPLQSLLI